MEIFKQDDFLVSLREDRFVVLSRPDLVEVDSFPLTTEKRELRDLSYLPRERVLLAVHEASRVLKISKEGTELSYESPSLLLSLRTITGKNDRAIIQLVETTRVVLTTLGENGGLRILQEFSRDSSCHQRGDLVWSKEKALFVAAAPVSNQIIVVGRETIQIPLEYSMVKLSEDGSSFVVISLDGRTFLVYRQGVVSNVFTRGFFSAEIRDVHLDDEFLVVGTTLGHIHLFYLNQPEKNTHSILDMFFGSYLGGGRVWSGIRRYVDMSDYLIASPPRSGETILVYDGDGHMI